MKIDFKTFVEYFNKVKEKVEKENEFLDAMNKYIGGIDTFLSDTSSTLLCIELLEELVGDTTSRWLEYYFFEKDCQPFSVEIDDESYHCDGTPLSLYNLINL